MTVLDIARGELGVKESPRNSNNVKYNTWYYGGAVSGAAYPWCMTFVQWCYDRAGAKLPYKTASCSALLDWYKRNRPAQIVTEPRPGDIIIYTFGHTGIYESGTGSTVTAIEGNTAIGNDSNGGEVMRRTRNRSLVKAFIRPGAESAGASPEGRSGAVNDAPAIAVQEPEPEGRTAIGDSELLRAGGQKSDGRDDEEEKKVTYEEFKAYMERYMAELSEMPAPGWARAELQEAIDAGITDGTSPMMLVPRYQAALMAKRAANSEMIKEEK